MTYPENFVILIIDQMKGNDFMYIIQIEDLKQQLKSNGEKFRGELITLKSEISNQGMDSFLKCEYSELKYFLSLINESIFLIDEIDYYHSLLNGFEIDKVQTAEIILTNYYKHNYSLEDIYQLEWIYDQLKSSLGTLKNLKSEVL
ncbi:hypothetical protein [Tetragenococcus phage phiYA5_2]|nr:hypothetical protein [Tetragenococcus phage phiYA5_2]